MLDAGIVFVKLFVPEAGSKYNKSPTEPGNVGKS